MVLAVGTAIAARSITPMESWAEITTRNCWRQKIERQGKCCPGRGYSPYCPPTLSVSNSAMIASIWYCTSRGFGMA
jgi:hypothetical protein